MNTEVILEGSAALINNKRAQNGLPELQTFVDLASDALAFDRIVCDGIGGEELSQDDWKDAALNFVEKALKEETDINAKFMSKNATHIDVQVHDMSQVSLLVYYRYLELEPIGPIIGGDLIVEGTTVVASHGTALCTVEYAGDEDENFKIIDTVVPWSIMFSPAPNAVEEGMNSFAIPIKVPEDCREGTLRVRVYVAPLEEIPFDEAKKGSYEPNPELFQCAIEFTKSSKEADQNALDAVAVETREIEGMGETRPRSGGSSGKLDKEVEHAILENDHVVVKTLHILLDLDELDSLHSQGYELHTLEFTEEGLKEDIPHTWRFYVVAEMGLASEGGLEDVRFITTTKAVGELPRLEGYEVLHDDLSDMDDKKSVFLAVKVGAQPRFSRAVMLTAGDAYEEQFQGFVNTTKEQVVKGPNELGNIFGGPFALIMECLEIPGANLNMGEEGFEEVAASDPGIGERDGSPDSLDDEEEDLFARSIEDNSINSMHNRIAELEAERDRLKENHVDIQRKAAAIFARDKALVGMVPGKSEPAASAGVSNEGNDTEAEREKHFVDLLQQVSDCRKKLFRQQQEFDQLAHDLQTRLDDKEYKANEIAMSFQEFKREIMVKAQNSRTGKPISKRLMEQYESAEQKKDGDLEKVRLRNISLRTTLKKLERQLRAREQLAEGLHMIDFEQLKIENQTLNEKIEERNEELAKLKRKKTSTVQVLTHIREKLKFVENQNEIVRSNLAEIEHSIMGQRSVLTSAKHDRDFVRDDNAELKRKQGFATNDLLLVDYEKRKSQMESVREEIKELQERYSILSTQLNTATGKSHSAGSTYRK